MGIKSGIVVSVNHADQTGIIEDKNGREFFFHVAECVEQKLPTVHSVVTFVKDPDFKSTDVATLVKVSKTYLRLAGTYVKAS